MAATRPRASRRASTRQIENFPPIQANTIDKNGDFNPGLGGPIVHDKLWFYLSARYQAANNFVPGMYHNRDANHPDPVTHIVAFNPDLSDPALAPRVFSVYMGRLTWQANPKHKFGATYDLESNCFCPDQVSATRSPEAGVDRRFPLQRFVQLDWSSPISSRLLLEASAIERVERWGGMNLQTGDGGNITTLDPTIIGISDVGLAPAPLGFNYGAAAQGLAPGSPAYNNSWNTNWHYRAALSYITGPHQIKVGFNNAWGHFENLNYDVNPEYYTFTNGVPSAVNIKDSPYNIQVNVDRDLGIFAQDRWTMKRWSLYGGVRYDSFKNSFPATDLLPTKFVPNRGVVHFPEQDNISWNDITPKLGASYDVFGNGKTAIKVSLNKYLLGYGTAGFFENSLSQNPNPINSLATSTTIGWNDVNGDKVPQCNLLNPAANGECTGWQNPNFGTLAPNTTYDPHLLTGWGKRNYNWEFSLGVQHEILPRVSVDLSYFRRTYGNFQMTKSKAVTAADFDTFTFTVPTDSRLPNSGATLTAVDLRFPLAFVPPDYFVSLADDQGVKITDHWDGFDLTVNARPRNGLTLQGGLSVGREALDECDLMHKFPENTLRFLPGPSAGDHAGASPSILPFFAATPLNYCNRNEGFAPQVKALGAVHVPEGRCADCRHIPEHSRRARRGAIPRFLHREPRPPLRHFVDRTVSGVPDRGTRLAAAGSDQPVRLPSLQDLQGGPNTDERELRSLQRLQQRCHHAGELYIHAAVHPQLVAAAPVRDPVSFLQAERAVRLLRCSGNRVIDCPMFAKKKRNRSMTSKQAVSRRSLLKRAAAAAGGATLVGASPLAAQPAHKVPGIAGRTSPAGSSGPSFRPASDPTPRSWSTTSRCCRLADVRSSSRPKPRSAATRCARACSARRIRRIRSARRRRSSSTIRTSPPSRDTAASAVWSRSART